MQELSPEMSEKERMTSVFTAAPRTVLLSETTDRLKLEVPDAMSPAVQVVQRTVEVPQVQFINRVGAHLSRATEAGTWRSANCADDCGAPTGAVLGQGCGHPRGWWSENECETLGRRRAEKVYSDLSDSSRRWRSKQRWLTWNVTGSEWRRQAVEGRSTTSQLDIRGSQWQGRWRDQVRSCKRFHRSSSCYKVVDMPVMVSSKPKP